MVIKRYTGPPVDTHTYVVADEESGEAWAIDAPLETFDRVQERVRERGYRLTRLILTHAHFDHILDAARYQEAGIPISLHAEDLPLLRVPQTLLVGFPQAMPSFAPDETLREGDILRLGSDEWQVWHVPGHAPGHVILYCAARGTVLGGDLLFHDGYGRVDLPGSSPALMAASLARLLELPDNTRVYPGHGPDTTLADERGWLKPLLRTGL